MEGPCTLVPPPVLGQVCTFLLPFGPRMPVVAALGWLSVVAALGRLSSYPCPSVGARPLGIRIGPSLMRGGPTCLLCEASAALAWESACETGKLGAGWHYFCLCPLVPVLE